MASAKKEETDLFDLTKDLVKNWHIMLPCLIRLASSLASSLEAKIERILFVSKKHQNQ
jgi:hypothetical protein